jgi:hypothetical protein
MKLGMVIQKRDQTMQKPFRKLERLRQLTYEGKSNCGKY